MLLFVLSFNINIFIILFRCVIIYFYYLLYGTIIVFYYFTIHYSKHIHSNCCRVINITLKTSTNLILIKLLHGKTSFMHTTDKLVY